MSADFFPVQLHFNSKQRCCGQLLKLDQHKIGCQRDVFERVDVSCLTMFGGQRALVGIPIAERRASPSRSP